MCDPPLDFDMILIILVKLNIVQILHLLLLSLTDEEIIFRNWDGDVLKVNTKNNETDLLLKNTTFVSLAAVLSLAVSQNKRHSTQGLQR